MNIPAKIWSWIITVWGAWAILYGLLGEEFDGYTMLGGLIILITGVVCLTYIWKDDAVRKKEKESADEERIARIVAERLK
jgi:uncharacterized membrane protein